MTEIHVSIQNQEAGNGTIESPYSSIQSAYDAVVNLKACGLLTLPVTIYVHEGVYHVQKALSFKENLPVTIRPYQNDQVIIDGGVEITGWKQVTLNKKKVFRAVLPENINPEEINQFYVNGELRQLASVPKAPDFFRVTDEPGSSWYPAEGKENVFHYDGNDFDSSWYDIENILVIMPHLWAEERGKIQSVDTETKTINLCTDMIHSPQNNRSEYRFYNVREALTEAGEYYIDRLEKAVYYIPVKGETLKNIQAVIPVTGSLVNIYGAKWLTLDHLQFRHGGGFYPYAEIMFDLRDGSNIENTALGYMRLKRGCRKFLESSQASIQVPGVIMFNNAENCTITNCNIYNSGWYGTAVTCGCKNIRLENNEMHHLGAGGVRIGGGRWLHVVEDGHKEMLTSHVVVKNNHIHDCCEIFLSAVGIIITDAKSCLVENNHIHDLYYSGISCGWTWGFKPQITAENRIIGNHIHDLGKGIISDMGGVYLLGVQPGTLVADNVIHDIQCRYYGGWGLYTDEGSSHIVLEHNLVYNCSCEAYHQHYGRENIVRENVFAFCKDAMIAVTNLRQDGYESPGPHYRKAISFYRNLLINDGKPFYRFCDVGQIFSNNMIDSENNIFCDYTDAESVFIQYPCVENNEWITKKIDLKAWQKQGYDICGKMIDDPGFKDVKKRDFRLKKNSVLLDLPWFKWLNKK